MFLFFSHWGGRLGLNPFHVALIHCLEITLALRNHVAGRDSVGLRGRKHGLCVRSEVYSLGHLSESAATSSSIELWHGVLVGLWQVGTCLKVGGTHLECEFFSIVRSAWSLALALRRWIEEVLRFLHLDGLHIVLVATGFQKDVRLGKLVLESIFVTS